jgi:hypothetical protein
MRVNILQIRLQQQSPVSSEGFDCCRMSAACEHSYPPKFEHRYVMVEQRQKHNEPGRHYYLCKQCGNEKALDDVCVIEMDHQHDYRNYRGCVNGFYILRCTHFGCESFLRIFNAESQICSNKGKHHLDT